MPFTAAGCKAASLVLFCLFLLTPRIRADWQRDESSIAWRNGSNIIWQFSFETKKGKPFFHPLNVPGGAVLTNFKPEDHPWHYGLWFSWKYINHVNYWEEDRATGKAEGSTRWMQPTIETHADGSAAIHLALSYVNPSNQVDMSETRDLTISALEVDGSYAIDWRAHFTAGSAGAVLDRTPMPGEPGGQVNGGYAGLGLRMAGQPLTMAVVCSTGLVTRFVIDRARPSAAAVGCNFRNGTSDVGGIAIFSDPKNAGENAPWYLINSDTMRFACAAILAPKVITLKPEENMDLHYRIIVRPRLWTSEALREQETKRH